MRSYARGSPARVVACGADVRGGHYACCCRSNCGGCGGSSPLPVTQPPPVTLPPPAMAHLPQSLGHVVSRAPESRHHLLAKRESRVDLPWGPGSLRRPGIQLPTPTPGGAPGSQSGQVVGWPGLPETKRRKGGEGLAAGEALGYFFLPALALLIPNSVTRCLEAEE